MLDTQVLGDLLRAPPLCQQLIDEAGQFRILLQPTLVVARPHGRRLSVRLERPVTAVLAAVAAQLS
jgi:hypothetical protein